ncbi:cystinosin-like [Raphidocelis subcapitata]|uniref:Cystinosin-like n=1 Tax=Raphidocelis subcapitata TaxID=307507 RepID=A0A2V0PJV7_9CHLO|nr:cystinosin-like [Raphidocelis subcapitata]|eukprot:GBF98273.1 cystinosin-like [Raphidocelis subcapitata]
MAGTPHAAPAAAPPQGGVSRRSGGLSRPRSSGDVSGSGDGGAGADLIARFARMPSWAVLLAVAAFGIVIGCLYPNPKLAAPWSYIQSATGWTYASAWSLSFYPQVVLNARRKSVTGLSFDFLVLNLLGWVAYSTFNVAIYFVFECPARKPQNAALAAAALSPAAASHWGADAAARAFLGAAPPAPLGGALGTTDFCQYAVEWNDVVFSLHALALTLVTLAQCCAYPRGTQRVHRAVAFGIAACVAAAAGYAAAIARGWRMGLGLDRWMSWLYWLYFLSLIKMGVTFVKYLPQAVMNFRRRSTAGWSILNILLDFTGGALSLGQQLLTAWWAGNWAPVTANPVKLGLALTSMGMDVLFMVQHYTLYPEEGGTDSATDDAKAAADGGDGSLTEPLLRGPRGVVVVVEDAEDAV